MINIHITTSTRSDGSMKSVHDSNTDDANQARIDFLHKIILPQNLPH